jgi:hypothetical protein
MADSRVTGILSKCRYVVTVWNDSAVRTTFESVTDAIGHAARSARIPAAAHLLGLSIQTVLDTAVTARVARFLLAVVRGSWLYRWLTAEPEPEVIVIDLRETVSLGPFIAAIDRALRWLLPATATAAVVHAAEHLVSVARRRPIRLASICLAVVVATGVPLLTLTGTLEEITLALAVVGGALAIAGLPVRATLEDVRQHPITRAFVAALEPPEPPETD